MSKDEEYRAFAASCLELAKANPRTDQKARLLAMAGGWLNLADRLTRNQARRVAEHPLIRKALGGFRGPDEE